MAKKHGLKIMTANQLLGGHSVFWSAEAGWTADHRIAAVAVDAEQAGALLAQGQASEDENEVVGVYMVDVEIDSAGSPQPTHYREKMRVRARPSFWRDKPDDAIRGKGLPAIAA